MGEKVRSLNELGRFLVGANRVFTSGCSGEISQFSDIFSEEPSIDSLNISGIFIPGLNRLNYPAMGNKFSCQTFFMTPEFQQWRGSGRVHYCPWRYRDVVYHYRNSPVDVAIVMLSAPDHNGHCTFGLTSDFSPIVFNTAKIKIGVVNTEMPSVGGDAGVLLKDLDAWVEIEQSLPVIDPPKNDPVSRAIASFVAPYINDGATLQLGLGKIPAVIADALHDRRQLKIRSGLIDDSILSLENAGALNPDEPILCGVGIGSSGFYRALDGNDRFKFAPVDITHDIESIAGTENFHAINGALEVDLFGQVNSHVVNDGFMSGPGGLPEFISGALRSSGGRSIIVLPATARGNTLSRIVPALQGGVPSVAATDADLVVTEFGCADLRGLTLGQRARALTAIAAPEHRDWLEQEWRQRWNYY